MLRGVNLPLLVLVIFLLNPVLILAQPPDTVDVAMLTDVNPNEPLRIDGKLYNGIVVKRSKTGQILEQETSLNGKRNGPAKYFYSNGKRKSEGNWKDGHRDGHWISWYEGGQVQQDGYFVMGNPHGFMKTYDIRNDVHVDGTYENGHFHGLVIGYKSTGDTIAFGEYQNGYKVGPWIEFDLDSNKTVYKIYPTVDELMATMPPVVTSLDLSESNDLFYYGVVRYTGTERTMYPSGKLHYEKTYVDGKPMTWKSYYEDGKPFIVAQYKDGKAHGKWNYYYESGIQLQEQEFTDGMKTGIWYQYNSQGVMQHWWTYSGDLLNGVHYAWHWQDPNNKSIEEYYLNGQLHGHSKHWYENGVMKMDQHFDYGKLDGVSVYYATDGMASQVITYKQDVRIEVADFYPGGINRSLSQFKDNNVHGVYKEWFSDGTLAVSGQHSGGFRTGQWFFRYQGCDSLEFVLLYDEDKVISCELKTKPGFEIFETAENLPADFTEMLKQLRIAVATENPVNLKPFFASKIMLDTVELSRDQFFNLAAENKFDLYGIISRSMSTGFAKQVKKPSSLSPEIYHFISRQFRITGLATAFDAGDLVLPAEKSFTLYQTPSSDGKPGVTLNGFCFAIDDRCAENNKSGECWYGLEFGGQTVYVNSKKLLHTTTCRPLTFEKISGKWQITAW